jgi:hypothetical protein
MTIDFCKNMVSYPVFRNVVLYILINSSECRDKKSSAVGKLKRAHETSKYIKKKVQMIINY